MCTESDIQILLTKAGFAQAHAHAPFSNFHVGSAAISYDGIIHASGNCELGSNTATCAEQGMLSQFAQGAVLKDVVVIGGNEGLCTPCGHCREALKNFADDDTRFHIFDINKKFQHSFFMEELLPDRKGYTRPANKDDYRGNAGFELYKKARSAFNASPAAYSGQKSGCSIRTQMKNIYSGAAVEIANYKGMAAAGVAVGKMKSANPADTIKRVVIIVPEKTDMNGHSIKGEYEAVSGADRQWLREGMNPDEGEIFVMNSKGCVLKYYATLSDFLPYSFGPDILGG